MAISQLFNPGRPLTATDSAFITMTEITLVRHGQASFGSDDYDQLSDLGIQQARWLGDYFAERELVFDRVVIGSQRRHRQTAEGIVAALAQSLPFEQHAGFNEYDFQALFDAFCQQYPEQTDTGYSDRRHFYAVLRKALLAWSEDRLSAALPESWSAFNRRVEAAMDFATRPCDQSPAAGRQKVLLVTSGGPISMIMRQIMTLDTEHMIRLNLQVINTSVSRLLKTRSGTHLMSFNSIAHLDQPARMDSITYS